MGPSHQTVDRAFLCLYEARTGMGMRGFEYRYMGRPGGRTGQDSIRLNVIARVADMTTLGL